MVSDFKKNIRTNGDWLKPEEFEKLFIMNKSKNTYSGIFRDGGAGRLLREGIVPGEKDCLIKKIC